MSQEGDFRRDHLNTCGHLFRKYHRLEGRLARELMAARKEEDHLTVTKLEAIRQRYFPSKEEVVAGLETFYGEGI